MLIESEAEALFILSVARIQINYEFFAFSPHDKSKVLIALYFKDIECSSGYISMFYSLRNYTIVENILGFFTLLSWDALC